MIKYWQYWCWEDLKLQATNHGYSLTWDYPDNPTQIVLSPITKAGHTFKTYNPESVYAFFDGLDGVL